MSLIHLTIINIPLVMELILLCLLLMEVRGTELHDELTMNDDDKCLASLVKVLSKANSGQDVAPYFNGVVVGFFSFTPSVFVLFHKSIRHCIIRFYC